MRVFDAHGGLERWQTMNSLTFELARESGSEKHFIQLKDRRDRIEGSNFTMGFDGSETWMEADTSYKGNPEFYHNLMFYFFAMPFVLADPGINYSAIQPLEFEGATYPGIGISYEESVGTSPKDQYYLYYNPDDHQMVWLGYTVTYFSQETSDDVHWIHYSDWTEFSGLKLPVTLTWYHYEAGLPTEPRNSVKFTDVIISGESHADELFINP